MLKNRKGFSLVELIVVIAIMAVLVGILAPTLITFVEKSRKQKDESALGELTNAIDLAIADETVYDTLPAASFTITFTNTDNVIDIDSLALSASDSEDAKDAILNAIKTTISDFKVSSKAYKGYDAQVHVNYDSDNKIFSVVKVSDNGNTKFVEKSAT